MRRSYAVPIAASDHAAAWARVCMVVVCMWVVIASVGTHPVMLIGAWLVTAWAVFGLLWWGVVRLHADHIEKLSCCGAAPVEGASAT